MRKFLSLMLVFLFLGVLSACATKPTLTINNQDKAFELAVGSQRTVTVSLSKDADVEWVSSDTDVVTVDSGTFLAIGVGTATVTVKIKGQETSQTISVTVVLPEVTEVFIYGLENIVLNNALQLTVAVQPAQANQEITWTSSTPAVATVDSSGKVVGVGAGKSIISATAVNGKKAQVEVTVLLPEPTNIKVSGASSLVVDETSTYTVTIAPEISDKEIVWSVNNEDVASIDQSGKVTALQAGIVKVIATSKVNNSIKGEMTVMVSLPDPESINITGEAALTIGQQVKYTASVLPAKANQEVSWSISNTNLASIDVNGNLSAIKGGTFKVIATSKVKNSIVSEYEVTIAFDHPTSITIDGKSLLNVGEVASYRVEVLPSSALQEVVWSISDDSVATINQAGQVTALAAGTVTITATAKADSEVTYQMTIEIIQPTLVGLELIGRDAILVGEESQYSIKTNPANATTDVIWSIDNESLATIDENGRLKALAAGTIVLTATAVENDEIEAQLTIIIREPARVFYVDANLQLEQGETLTYKDEVFIVGLSAFKSLSEAANHIKDESTIFLMKGTYSGRVIIKNNNVKIIGPNAGISAFEKMSSRIEEAILTSVIEISGTTGFFLDGVALKGTAQIYASTPVKDVTIQNVNAYEANVPAGEGIIYFGLASGINENINVYHSSFKDNLATGYRAIRVNNAKNTEIKFNYLYGFFDAIRFEGTANADSKGPGMHGKFIVENNRFEMNVQYPILASRWSNAEVSIRYNYIAVDPAQTKTYGIVYLNNYLPEEDVKSVVHIQYNEVPYNTAWHQIRTNSKGATASQLEFYVNYNVFDEVPGVDGTTQLTHIADHWETSKTDFVIDGTHNYFKYDTDVLPIYFINTIFEPFHRHEDEVGALFVNPLWASEVNGATVTYKHLTVTIGTNAFATLSEALSCASEGDTIFLLPGTHTGNVTIQVKNLKITSFNGEINPNSLSRGEEAIYTGVITLGKELSGLIIAGIKFIDKSQILNTLGNAGTSSVVAKNINGFTFKNNIVDSDLESGKGFIYFKEAASSYSYDLNFINNLFTVSAQPTTLAAVIYLDNNAGLHVVGNVFKDISCDAFYVFDTTKGLAGDTFVEGNTFTNIGQNAFWINWFSPIPSTTMSVKVVNNHFTNIGGTGIYFGSLNNTDVMKEVNIQFNTFDNFKNGIVIDRVHLGANYKVHYNIFRSVATDLYIKDNKSAAAPVTLEARYNLYLNNNEVITPDSAKFAGSPSIASPYTSESQVPVYSGEGEIDVAEIKIASVFGPFYVDDVITLEVEFTPTNATTKEVSWKSSDATIATVDNLGKVTFIGSGTVMITVTSNHNPEISDTLSLEVVVFSTIELSDSGNGVIEVGKTSKLNAKVYPASEAGTLTFTSLNPAIATVDSEGNITAVSAGEVEIEVKIGGLTATMTYVISKAKTSEFDPIQFIMDANINVALMRPINTFGNTVKTEFTSGSVSNLWFNNIRIIEVLMEGRPKTKLDSVEFIVVHDTGNNNVGSNAFMHSNFLKNNTSLSWHYTVDDDGAYRHVPDDEVAYHAGDGLRSFGLNATGVNATVNKPLITISSDGYYELNGQKSTVAAPLIDGVIAKTNQIAPAGIYTTIQDGQYYINNTYYNSTYKLIANQGGGTSGIGIESAVDEGSDLYKTWQNLAQLVAKLLVENDLDLDRVTQHNNFSGKNCPQTLRTANLWDQLLTMIEFEYKRILYFSDYNFKFVSNNPKLVNNEGKIIGVPRVDTEVSYTVTITNNSGYNESVTLYTTIPGTR